jgi:hypothetical protein
MFGKYGMMDSNTGQPELLKWIWPFVILDLVLKAFALWRSARRGDKWWFIPILLINTLGILPGIYLLTHKETPKLGKKK